MLGILRQQFGDRLQTGQAIREQHGHTTTWIATEAPDGVVFPHSTEEVAQIVTACATHQVPVIAFGIGSSLEGHVNAPPQAPSRDVSKEVSSPSLNFDVDDLLPPPEKKR